MELPIARLVYLLSRHRIVIPRRLQRYLPGEAWISQLHLGLSTAATAANSPLEYFQKLYEEGATLGLGSEMEGRLLVSEIIDGELGDRDLQLTERLKIYSDLDRFASRSAILEDSDTDLSEVDVSSLTGIPKFDSGFTPLDIATGGLYQGLLVLMARPATGKTSVMVAIIESLVKRGHSILFVQNEIPQQLMLGRMKPVFERVKFKPTDRLVCGSWGSPEILDYIRENPDPNRVIFFDSPDVIASSSGDDSRRFTLERIYQELIRAKQHCKLIVVSSQPRRNDETIKMTSVAESWAKAWYADMIVGLQSQRGTNQLQLNVVKNRFGPPAGKVTFDFDYSDLTWQSTGQLDEEDDW